MPLPCLLKEQICCHLLPPLLEGTPPQLPPKKLERPFALFGPNPNVNIPELNSIAASYIIKIIFMSMPKSTQSNLNFDNHIWLTTMIVSNPPDGNQESKNKHGYATRPTLLLIIRNLQGPKSSTYDIGNTYKSPSWKLVTGRSRGQLNLDNGEVLPSPPHIMANEINPTGDSRQKIRAHKINIRT